MHVRQHVSATLNFSCPVMAIYRYPYSSSSILFLNLTLRTHTSEPYKTIGNAIPSNIPIFASLDRSLLPVTFSQFGDRVVCSILAHHSFSVRGVALPSSVDYLINFSFYYLSAPKTLPAPPTQWFDTQVTLLFHLFQSFTTQNYPSISLATTAIVFVVIVVVDDNI